MPPPDPVLQAITWFYPFYLGVLACFLLFEELRTTNLEKAMCWALRCALCTAVAVALFILGGALYFRPPVWVSLYPQTIHGDVPNSFPSHHALVVGLITAFVAFASPRRAIPFGIVAVVVDWALVASQTHHITDVLASTVFVAVAYVSSRRIGLENASAVVQGLPAPVASWLGARLHDLRREAPPHGSRHGHADSRLDETGH